MIGLALATLVRPADATGEVFHSTALGTGFPAHQARVVVVEDRRAVRAFLAEPAVVSEMFGRALLQFTRKSSPREAWLGLVSTQDIIGLKVYSAPGPLVGTRPAVVEAVVRSLLAAGFDGSNVVIWDKNLAELKAAGFVDLARRLGVEAAGAAEAGYDEKEFHEKPFIGFLVYGDLEFGKTTESKGRRSFVSKLLTQRLTKLISIAPMLSHNAAGVAGHLFSLSVGSVDNTLRFESDADRLAETVPEIYALPQLSDRVVLNVVDALICQYQGENQSMLHYSAVLNELRLGTDPVALDVLSLREINRQRLASSMPVRTNAADLYLNAGLMELGASEDSDIGIEKVP